MAKQISTYTANTSGIAPNQVISSASEIAARTNSATAINNNSEVLQEVRTFMESLDQGDSIRYVDYGKFSNGTNELDIVADAIIWWDDSVYEADKTADADLTGWPAITLSSLSNSTTYWIWATYVSGTKSYEATVQGTLPSNLTEKALISIVTVDGAGALSREDIWQGPDQCKANRWRDKQTMMNGVDIYGALNVQGNTNTVYALPTNYHDVKIEYTSASTITIKAGSRARSSDDTTDIIIASDLTIDLTVSGAGGLDTGSEANSTFYHSYLIYNPTTGQSNVVASATSEANTGSITLPSGYTKKVQIKNGAIWNNASGNIEEFRKFGDFTKYVNAAYGASHPTEVATGLTGSTTVSCGTVVPPTSRKALITIRFVRFAAANGSGDCVTKEAGTSGAGSLRATAQTSTGTTVSFSINEFVESLNTSQQFSQTTSGAGSGGVSFIVQGYWDTEVNK